MRRLRFDAIPQTVYSRSVRLHSFSCLALVSYCVLLPAKSFGANLFRVATYNLQNYLDEPTETRPAKSPESKAKVRESIRAASPDVLALQEVGTTNALLELRDSLRKEGLDFPYWLHVPGADTNIHVALLSRFPVSRSRLYANEQFLLSGRRFNVSRGFCEAQFQVSSNYSFTLLAAHLKSKRAVSSADETELRTEEAKLLREKVDALLAQRPDLNLIVAGDFNDTKDSSSTRAVLGRGRNKLIDARPAERNGDGDCIPAQAKEQPTVTWTHFYAKEDSYRRIDFLLISPGMGAEWVPSETFIPTVPGWGIASDHRPIVATFVAQEN